MEENKDVILRVRGLKKYYPVKKSGWGKRLYVRANDGIDLEIFRGETFALVGESGCGKSTLGKAILQLDAPTGGEVSYIAETGTETELTKTSKSRLRALRRKLQIVFQDPYSSLNPRKRIGELIGEGVWTHGIYKKNSAELKEYVLGIMERCGLGEHVYPRYPHEFSGGQRQRVCIARALALQPEFVVCDECVSALDVSIQSQILNLLSQLKAENGLTYLFITHDLSVVRQVADRVAVMYLGKIVESGAAEKVFASPLHPYTLALISAVPRLKERKNGKIVLEGQMPSPVFPPKGCPFHTRCFMKREICETLAPPLKEIGQGHFVACHFAETPISEKRAAARK